MSTQPNQVLPGEEPNWLDLARIATVEVTSEDPAYPIEAAFGSADNQGWRASEPGEQHIRIVLDQPQTLRRIRLRFVERERERTQEFTLRWLPAEGGPLPEIVRQQWNFSPGGSTTEVEDYAVNLTAASSIELTIKPDIGNREAIASLASLQLGQ